MNIENKSGLIPVGYSVLVLPEQVETETALGITVMTETQAEREQLKQTDGVVIAIGPHAFHDEPIARCKVGDKVIMAAYAGMVRKGMDDVSYRIIKDNDIIAILNKD